MHEMALSASVLRIIEEQAAAEGFRHVRSVVLEVGALAAVDPEALRFSFEAAARGGLAEGARLEIEVPPGEAWCADCERTVTIDERIAPCPRCGAYGLKVTGGDQMRVRELEVD